MLQIFSALAKRLGLDGVELKKLAKDWADTHPFDSSKLLGSKGKGKEVARTRYVSFLRFAIEKHTDRK
jgi:hypothetical protein